MKKAVALMLVVLAIVALAVNARVHAQQMGYIGSSKGNTGGGSAAPNGAAGGDLSGTYPNPGVAQINGYPVTNSTPTIGCAVQGVAGGYACVTPSPTSTPSQTPTPAALIAMGGMQNMPALAFVVANSYYLPYAGLPAQLSSSESGAGASTPPISSIYTVKNLQCACNSGPGGGVPGNTLSFAFRNTTTSTDSALTCSMQGAAKTCSDVSHSFLSVAGNLYSLHVYASPGATATTTIPVDSCYCSVGP